MKTEFQQLSDILADKVRRDLERAMRDKIGSQYNDLLEACIKKQMEKMTIALDAETMKVNVTFKD